MSTQQTNCELVSDACLMAFSGPSETREHFLSGDKNHFVQLTLPGSFSRPSPPSVGQPQTPNRPSSRSRYPPSEARAREHSQHGWGTSQVLTKAVQLEEDFSS